MTLQLNQQRISPPKAWLAVLISGILQIAIFPKLDISWLAYVSFVPLFLLLPGCTPRRLFLYFYISGFLFQMGNLYWITFVIQHYTTLSVPLAVGVNVLLCLVLSLFWGILGLVLGWFGSRSSLERALFLAPWIFILLERGRSLTTHFPWCLLGYSQYSNLRIAQIASFTGVYGLSFFVIAWNAAIAIWILRRKHSYAVAMAAISILAVSYGHFRISQPAGNRGVTVACIQGNVPQDEKMDFEFAEEVNERHLAMTRKVIQFAKPGIVFWSESSTLFPLRSGGEWTNKILNLARETSTPLLIGSDTFIDKEVYNSALLVNKNGEIEDQYDKMYLVPFGEFVPFKEILFFAGKVVPEISDFTHGKNYTLFEIPGGRFGVHICFEVVFPQLSRQFTKKGATLLVTITNDAWFGNSAAPYQHFAMAVLRAIENRRYLVRAANTGISGIVDPYGRILQATSLYQTATVTGQVQWIEEKTFYARYGDLLIYIAIAMVSGVLSVAIFKTPQQTAEPESS